ncbi:hypothetical protein VP01_183g1 [Puccinia sorghi]|uniref:Uncharacterized protein n=1 Tax=Puccinia sorghi TaxID=27349 RepID=A0A0L6VFL8_9BASI|nr:hypothetical protein VP01_183g1 [Puccinia sorghi]
MTPFFRWRRELEINRHELACVLQKYYHRHQCCQWIGARVSNSFVKVMRRIRGTKRSCCCCWSKGSRRSGILSEISYSFIKHHMNFNAVRLDYKMDEPSWRLSMADLFMWVTEQHYCKLLPCSFVSIVFRFYELATGHNRIKKRKTPAGMAIGNSIRRSTYMYDCCEMSSEARKISTIISLECPIFFVFFFVFFSRPTKDHEKRKDGRLKVERRDKKTMMECCECINKLMGIYLTGRGGEDGRSASTSSEKKEKERKKLLFVEESLFVGGLSRCRVVWFHRSAVGCEKNPVVSNRLVELSTCEISTEIKPRWAELLFFLQSHCIPLYTALVRAKVRMAICISSSAISELTQVLFPLLSFSRALARQSHLESTSSRIIKQGCKTLKTYLLLITDPVLMSSTFVCTSPHHVTSADSSARASHNPSGTSHEISVSRDHRKWKHFKKNLLQPTITKLDRNPTILIITSSRNIL